MVSAENTFEGGSNGTTISAANSGGASGDAFDTVTIGGATTLAFDNAQAAHGSLSAKIIPAASSTTVMEWSTTIGTQTEIWGRAYVYLTANPASTWLFARGQNGATNVFRVALTTSRLVRIDYGSANTVGHTSAVAVPLDTWARIEWHVIASATVGQVEYRLFNNADSVTVTETESTAANLNVGTQITLYQIGAVQGAATLPGTFWLDDLEYDTAGWIGPAAGGADVGLVATTTYAPPNFSPYTLPSLPAHQAGARLILAVTGKSEVSTIPTIDQSWVLLQSGTGGTGTAGVDTGQMFWAIYGKDATSGAETPPTVTGGATNVNSWEMICSSHLPGVGKSWRDAIATSAAWVQSASDTDTASPLTGTAGAFTGVQPTAGDAIWAIGGVPTDLGTALGATTLTATGLSGGTITAATGQYVETTLGNDSAAVWASWTDFTGTASAGLACSFTVTGATNQSGVLVAVALRQQSAATDATATPAVIATTAALPAPTVVAVTAVSPAAVATVAALPGPTVQTGTRTSPATVATTTTLPAPALSTGQRVNPATIATVSTLPAPTITTGSNATATPATIATSTAVGAAAVSTSTAVAPSAVATLAALPAPSVSTGQRVSAVTVATVGSLPAPTLSTGTRTSPASVATVSTLPAPTVSSGSNATATPATVATVGGVPAPSLSTGSTVTPAVVATAASLPAPFVSTGSNATATPAAIATASAVGAPSLQTGSTVSAVSLATAAAVPAPTLSTGTRPSPATVATVAGLPAPTVQTGTTVTAVAVVTVAALPAPTVQAGANATVTAVVVATVTAVPAPSVSTGSNATVSAVTVATAATLPAPALSTGSRVTAVAIATSSAVGSAVVVAETRVAAVVIGTTTALPAPSLRTGSTIAAQVIASFALVGVPIVLTIEPQFYGTARAGHALAGAGRSGSALPNRR